MHELVYLVSMPYRPEPVERALVCVLAGTAAGRMPVGQVPSALESNHYGGRQRLGNHGSQGNPRAIPNIKTYG